jgi:hypothetical protein
MSELTVSAIVLDIETLKALCDLTKLTLDECQSLGLEKLQALIERIQYGKD